MTIKVANRAMETTTTTGTGSFTLSGVAVSGYQSFTTAGANTLTVDYAAEGINADGSLTGEYEVGRGVYTTAGNALTRATILESSNADAVVNFSAGTKRVFITVATEDFPVLQNNNLWTISQSFQTSGGSVHVLVVNTDTMAFRSNAVNVFAVSKFNWVAYNSTATFGWTASASVTVGLDTGVGRNAAGIMEVNNGTLGTLRDVKVRQALINPVPVASLIAAATAGNGARAHVTDALAPTFGATVAGGGAVSTPVYSDGTNWKVG